MNREPVIRFKKLTLIREFRNWLYCPNTMTADSLKTVTGTITELYPQTDIHLALTGFIQQNVR